MKFHQIENKWFCYSCGHEACELELFTSVSLHCEYCEKHAREVREEGETTKPLFEDWWADLAVGDQFVVGGTSHRTVSSKSQHSMTTEESGQEVVAGVSAWKGIWWNVTPIPREPDCAQLRSQGTSGSLQTHSTPVDCSELLKAGARVVEGLDRYHGVDRTRTPPPQGSVLPETSGKPNQQDYSVELGLIHSAMNCLDDPKKLNDVSRPIMIGPSPH
jgi:hypothetical protein